MLFTRPCKTCAVQAHTHTACFQNPFSKQGVKASLGSDPALAGHAAAVVRDGRVLVDGRDAQPRVRQHPDRALLAVAHPLQVHLQRREAQRARLRAGRSARPDSDQPTSGGSAVFAF